MAEKDNFPQYRKYRHHRTFFKITGPAHFLQLDIVGNRYDLHEVFALQYPEKQRIQDMLHGTDDHWEISSQEEYEEKLTYCQSELEPLH